MDDSSYRLGSFIVGAVIIVAGFLLWHIKTYYGLKDQINKLDLKYKDEVQNLQLKVKDLEKTDELQQQTIDRLPELYPLLHTLIVERLKKK
jgi:hypothetical protein